MSDLTEAELARLAGLEGWPLPWRTDTDSEGFEADVVADNAAYPDEIAHIAEFSDERDARLAVAAVNALPALVDEVRRRRASAPPQSAYEGLRAEFRLLLMDYEAGIRRLSDMGEIPRGLNHANRERWAALAARSLEKEGP